MDGVLPYVRVVDPDFTFPESPPSRRRQRLQSWVNRLSRAVDQAGKVAQVLESLAAAQGGELRRQAVLSRLQELARAKGERALLDEAERLFGSVLEFREAIRLLRAWG